MATKLTEVVSVGLDTEILDVLSDLSHKRGFIVHYLAEIERTLKDRNVVYQEYELNAAINRLIRDSRINISMWRGNHDFGDNLLIYGIALSIKLRSSLTDDNLVGGSLKKPL